MDDKESVLTEHKENVRRNRMIRHKYWKYSTLILLIVLIMGAYYVNANGLGQGSEPADVVVDENAVNNAVDYINKNMLAGLATATLVSATEEGDLYKLDLEITTTDGLSEAYVSYVTKDGNLLFPGVIEMRDTAEEETTEEVNTTEEVAEEETTEEVNTTEEVAEEETTKEVNATEEVVEVNTTEEANVTEAIEEISDAPVVIKEFSDFQCSFCGKAYWTMKLVKDEYGDQVDIVFKHSPLEFHEYAQKAAEASECARDQDMFDEYHDTLFEHPEDLTIDDLKQYAVDLELDTETFDACLDSDEKAVVVALDVSEGKQAGVTGTPTFFINEEMLVGALPFSDFQTIIDLELAKLE